MVWISHWLEYPFKWLKLKTQNFKLESDLVSLRNRQGYWLIS